MASEDEVNYNRLVHIYQEEKKGGPPVHLPGDFHERVRDYLERLRASYDQERSKDPSSMKSLQLADQLQKARVLQVDIINLRMRKFLLLAHQTLTGSSVDTKNYTPEERQLVETIVAELCQGRNRILEGAGAEPLPGERSSDRLSPPVGCSPPGGAGGEPGDGSPAARAPPAERAPQAPSGVSLDSNSLIVVRILEDVPDFALDEKSSTSLKKKDVVALPRNLARVLEQHKRAKPVV